MNIRALVVIGLPLAMPTYWVHLVLVVFVVGISTGQALGSTRGTDRNIGTLRAILEMPEERIDLAQAKLAIDHMIDPSIDVASTINWLDTMAGNIKSRLPANASSWDKLEALRTYVYKAGPWNGYQAFRYDLDDPFGKDIRNKLLPSYLATRKGNCVSMPLLFIILGQKIGLSVTASTAPDHLFVKFRDERGNLYNLEATSGAGFARDVWMQQQMPMTPRALANGIYMQPLSKKETVAVMIDSLLEFYGQQGQEERRIDLAGLVLEYYPKDVTAMLHVSASYYRLRQQHFVSKYPKPRDIPVEQRPYFLELERGIAFWRGKAETLGWRESDEATNANYLQSVTRAKSVQ